MVGGGNNEDIAHSKASTALEKLCRQILHAVFLKLINVSYIRG